MNKYAVSPVPPSNARGSDFGLDFFTMEWEEDFPFDGQYIIKGNADAAIRDLFIDGEKVITLSVYNQAPVKVKKFFSEVADDLHLLEEDAIETSGVDLNVAARFIDLIQESHLLLHYSDDFVDMATMRMYKLLFFLQNLLDQLLVVIAELVHISSVLAFQLSFSLDFVFESEDFDR